jgi:hypothetical protein
MLRDARTDVAVFAEVVGQPLAPYQAEALRLEARETVVQAPRQTGKSRSLALLAAWWAFSKPGQVVLLVSAGEVAANRLLGQVLQVCRHELLAGSVLDESRTLLTLSNGSTIRSVPASEAQIRGWSVDLLILDEAAYIAEDVVVGAALPTTAARPGARIVWASSPWSDSGPFWAVARRGLDGSQDAVRTFRWRLADAWWISPGHVEEMRARLSPLRFRAEYEGEFVGSADAFLPADEIRAAVAPYALWDPALSGGGSVTLGCDWGRAFDSHAVVAAGVLQDWGANGRAVLFLPYLEASRRPYGEQVVHVASLEAGFDVQVVTSETNGVGAYPTEELERVLSRRVEVVPVASSQRSKEDAYGRLRVLLSRQQLVLPDDVELLRQLGGLVARTTERGGLSIAAATDATHDDLPDALSMALAGLPAVLPQVAVEDEPDDVVWLRTGCGLHVPAAPCAIGGHLGGRRRLRFRDTSRPGASAPSAARPGVGDSIARQAGRDAAWRAQGGRL